MINNQAQGNGPMSMMYAVVLQNAAEGARIADLERRMINNPLVEEEEHEEEMNDNQEQQE